MLETMNLSQIHSCNKSKGKIVTIQIDSIGITRCAYCGQIVNYLEHAQKENRSGSVTFGDMAEALYRLRQRYGLYHNPSEQEILNEALKIKNN